MLTETFGLGSRDRRSPEENLCAAVILQAVQDLFAPRPKPDAANKHAVRDWLASKQSARTFLFGSRSESTFSIFCEWLGYDPEVLRQGLNTRLRCG